MRALRPALAACVLAALTGCATPGRSSAPRSVSGTVAHGDVVAVPSGTVNDWSLMVAPMRMGVEEPRSENDNRLLAIRVFATVANDTSWQVTAQYRFGYALNNASVFWVPGSANYLLVRR
ncbi:MAG: hypothetical protein AVDCRST_MAG68-652 [uncultured Gemmatimonadetes bacterium]|uniref:Uncharacterized protein n=1 Tax=uncultured Gemmatimonadota bacterium TaxID=203437 RepID=A0A6J4KGZ6_9BACT|nr:MAG: hypothetical protein AVDCRST_MAG68-652 [uncultured Gemmatimonadota bacterium]